MASFLALPLTLAMAAGATNAPTAPPAKEAYDRLATLQGEWEGSYANGKEHRVSYRLSAAGTALVETWDLGPGKEAMTVYYIDGDRLLATHFCPHGTQPRLQLVDQVGGELRFEIIDGTGLSAPGRSHQVRFAMEVRTPDSFARSEAYIENNARSTEAVDEPAVVYTRTTRKGA
jgi:hypothetical protein